MKKKTLTQIVGSLSLGALVTFVGCKGGDAPPEEGGGDEVTQPAEEEEPASQPAEGEGAGE